MKETDMSNIEQPEHEGEESADSTDVIYTNMRQRRMALIMGVGCLISAGIALWTFGWDGERLTVTGLLIATGSALVLYWKTGVDPQGFGKPVWGKKNTD